MKEYLERFSEVSILVVGDVMLDLYLSGSVERVSPEAPVPILKVHDRRSVLGGAANVAANASGLGAKVFLAGVIGDDSQGGEILKGLADSGIDTGCLVRSAGRPTTVKTRLIAQHHQLARYDTEDDRWLDEEESAALSAALEDRIAGCDAVIVSDYAKGVVSPEFMTRLITKSAEASIPVFVDPKGVDFTKYRSATILTPNEREAIGAAVHAGVWDGDIATSGEALREHLGLPGLLVTRGEKGMQLFEEGSGGFEVAALERNVFDVTGAGDTVISTLAVAAAAGADLKTAASMANLAAGRVVERLGTAAVSIEDLAAELEG